MSQDLSLISLTQESMPFLYLRTSLWVAEKWKDIQHLNKNKPPPKKLRYVFMCLYKFIWTWRKEWRDATRLLTWINRGRQMWIGMDIVRELINSSFIYLCLAFQVTDSTYLIVVSLVWLIRLFVHARYIPEFIQPLKNIY